MNHPVYTCLSSLKIIMNRKEFAEKRRHTAENSIPELINLLKSEDLQTRFFAEMCLRDATGI